MSAQILPQRLRLAGLADQLADTLSRELDSLRSVSTLVGDQMTALSQADYPRVEEKTPLIDGASHKTGELREAHRRQARLLIRIATGETEDEPTIERVLAILEREPGHEAFAARISELRAALREEASKTERRRAALEFSLLSAQQVGHDLMGALHAVMGPATTSIYTSRGKTEQASGGRTLLNRVG